MPTAASDLAHLASLVPVHSASDDVRTPCEISPHQWVPTYPEGMGARRVRPRLSGHDVAQLLADRLAGVYGPRLRRVILFGSWARGEASWEDSDVDLLVVLDVVEDLRAEDARVDSVADDLFIESGHPVAAFPVAEAELASPTRPSLRSALREGIDFTPARV